MCHGSKLTYSLEWTKLTNSLGNNDLHFRVARVQVVHFWNSGKCVCQPSQANNFYAVMAAKRFQTRPEEELNSFYVTKARNLLTRPPTMPWKRWETYAKSKIWMKASKNWAKQFYFELGGITKQLMTGPTGNSDFCFPSTLNVPGSKVNLFETREVSVDSMSLICVSNKLEFRDFRITRVFGFNLLTL